MVKLSHILNRLAAIPEDVQDYVLKRNADPVSGLPVIITGSIRSGTTMFAELFNNGRTEYYHEPFIRKSLFWDSTLPEDFEFPADLDYVHETWNKIQAQDAWSFYRKTKSKHPYITKGALHRIRPFSKRRIIIKDPSLSYWMDSLLKITGPAHPIFILRDPRAIAGSIMKLGWDPGERMDRILQNVQFEKYQTLLPSGKPAIERSTIERIAIQIAILHASIYEQIAKIERATVVYFEELILSTDKIFEQLTKQLQLPIDFFEKEFVNSILHNRMASKDPHQYQRESKSQLNVWKQRLSVQEANIVQHIYQKINPPYQFSVYAE